MSADTDTPIPRATYRLQFTNDFGFEDAARLAVSASRSSTVASLLFPLTPKLQRPDVPLQHWAEAMGRRRRVGRAVPGAPASAGLPVPRALVDHSILPGKAAVTAPRFAVPTRKRRSLTRSSSSRIPAPPGSAPLHRPLFRSYEAVSLPYRRTKSGREPDPVWLAGTVPPRPRCRHNQPSRSSPAWLRIPSTPARHRLSPSSNKSRPDIRPR
jgi:hypothetical protein